MKITPLIIRIALVFILSSCNNQESSIPYLLSFDHEKVLRSSNEKTGALESRIHIPSDFPDHPHYVRYGEDELNTGSFKLKDHVQIYDDSVVVVYDVNNSGCMSVEPKGRFEDGTLYLDYKYISDGCKEEEIYRLKYVVEKNEKVTAIKFKERELINLNQ